VSRHCKPRDHPRKRKRSSLPRIAATPECAPGDRQSPRSRPFSDPQNAAQLTEVASAFTRGLKRRAAFRRDAWEDVFQDLCARALHRFDISPYDDSRGPFSAYLVLVVRSQAASMRRERRGKCYPHLQRVGSLSRGDLDVPDHDPPDPQSGRAIERAQHSDVVKRIVQTVDVDLLRAFLGESTQSVARRTGAARSTIRDAKKRMREALRARFPD